MGLSEEETARRTEDMLKLLGIEELRDRAPKLEGPGREEGDKEIALFSLHKASNSLRDN